MIQLFVCFSDLPTYTTFDLENIVTLLKVNKFAELLCESNYNKEESEFLVDGFTNGFNIGYQGPSVRQSESENIPFDNIGSKEELWEKTMKEVKKLRVAGPFEHIPFSNYIQSPIGLVPKAGWKTRMIFHLSYNFNSKRKGKKRKNGGSTEQVNDSLNECTLKHLCTVKYNDLDAAVHQCLVLLKQFKENQQQDRNAADHAEGNSGNNQPIIFLGKTDLSSAFCILLLKISCICWLVFKAIDPRDGKYKYFVDKCLPFGASISCSHYQRFSNALKHLLTHRTGENQWAVTNYLDDFLFLALAKFICNQMISHFLVLCNELNIPMAFEKTDWADTIIVFLSILLDGKNRTLSIPLDKQQKALALLNDLSGKKKSTIKQLQVLTRY